MIQGQRFSNMQSKRKSISKQILKFSNSLDTKGKSFLNAAPPTPSYERSQMSNVIETHKPDVWVHLWWALVWHKNLNFNNFVTVNSFIYIFLTWKARIFLFWYPFCWSNSANQNIQRILRMRFSRYFRWIWWHMSWSPDPKTNFERTNPNFYDLFKISFCLFYRLWSTNSSKFRVHNFEN